MVLEREVSSNKVWGCCGSDSPTAVLHNSASRSSWKLGRNSRLPFRPRGKRYFLALSSSAETVNNTGVSDLLKDSSFVRWSILSYWNASSAGTFGLDRQHPGVYRYDT